MGRLEKIDGSNWRELTQAPLAVLMIGKSDCPACAEWTEELEKFLTTDQEFENVRFGKMLLDQGGLIDFKRANKWLADVDHLPFNVIYTAGEMAKSYPGGGIDRLVDRLRAVGETT
jgi:hypothetical protein